MSRERNRRDDRISSDRARDDNLRESRDREDLRDSRDRDDLKDSRDREDLRNAEIEKNGFVSIKAPIWVLLYLYEK